MEPRVFNEQSGSTALDYRGFWLRHSHIGTGVQCFMYGFSTSLANQIGLLFLGSPSKVAVVLFPLPR
jgi:hypothetical protein